MNLCIFVGRATKDPSVRMTTEGSQVASFSLAVDSGYGDNKRTNFLEMVGFGNRAESISKYIRQGTKIIVQASAQQNIWTDKDGHKNYGMNFVIQSWEFAEAKRNTDATVNVAGGATEQQAQPQTTTQTSPDGFMNIAENIDDEVPFS